MDDERDDELLATDLDENWQDHVVIHKCGACGAKLYKQLSSGRGRNPIQKKIRPAPQFCPDCRKTQGLDKSLSAS